MFLLHKTERKFSYYKLFLSLMADLLWSFATHTHALTQHWKRIINVLIPLQKKTLQKAHTHKYTYTWMKPILVAVIYAYFNLMFCSLKFLWNSIEIYYSKRGFIKENQNTIQYYKGVSWLNGVINKLTSR